MEPDSKTITLDLKINTEICAVMDYFEIFTGRMLLCRKAAEFLGLQFKLDILWSMLDAMSMAYELKRPPYHSVTSQRVWHKGITL